MTASRHPITDQASIMEFLLAGRARFTLVSKKTGARFTYRVVRKKKPALDAADIWFVSYLNGQSNEEDYTYIGCFKRALEYLHSPKSRTRAVAPAVVAISWFLKSMGGRGKLPENVEFWHEGRCGRCGRALTVPSSIARGIGPECADILHIDPISLAESVGDEYEYG